MYVSARGPSDAKPATKKQSPQGLMSREYGQAISSIMEHLKIQAADEAQKQRK